MPKDVDPAVAAATAVQAVSLKLPTFLATRPDVWFQQTEAQFAIRSIIEQTTKYFYLLTALDPVVAERMAGDVASVPVDNKYSYLKEKLMEVYGLTDDQKADQLLDLAGLGDWKPSQLCAHIQSLTVDKDVILRRIFLRQLPEDVRVQVAALDNVFCRPSSSFWQCILPSSILHTSSRDESFTSTPTINHSLSLSPAARTVGLQDNDDILLSSPSTLQTCDTYMAGTTQ